MIVIGHRGCRDGVYSENTLAAIGAAMQMGVRAIEIDVRWVDGHLLVIHDDTLERTTNGRGCVYTHSLAALRALDAGGGEPIPLLDEVLAQIDARAGLNIELKDTASARPVLAAVTTALQTNPAWSGRLMLSSFESSIHKQLAREQPPGCLFGLLTGEVSDDLVVYARSLGAWSLNLSLQQLSPTLIQAAHGQGLKVLVYTVNDPHDLAQCQALGVDGVYTDVPEQAIASLDGGDV